MSTALVDGGPAGPDEAGGKFRHRIVTRRIEMWEAMGGRQGIRRGGVHSTVAGQMILELTAFLALVEERDSLGVGGTNRGYAVWSDDDVSASFGVASAADRNDAVVIAFCDVAAGAAALGTETTTVGGQVVVVPGVSGVSTPRTDADIQAAVGSGGWFRYADVLIASTDTEINPANVTLATVTTKDAYAKISKSAAQVDVPNNTTTGVTFSTVVEETHKGMADTANNRLVIKVAGLYDIRARVAWEANDTGRRDMTVRVNGAAVLVDRRNPAAGAAQTVWCQGEPRLRLAVSDLIDLTGLQTSGAGLDILAGDGTASECSLSALWVAP